MMERAKAEEIEAAGLSKETQLCRFIQFLLYNSE
jgi:hypothetical protein